MLTISVPTSQHLPDPPRGVEVLEWDGLGPPPPGVERIEYFVGRYNAAPPPAAVLAGLPRLRVIQVLSAGVEPWLPVVPDGVLLCNGRGIHGGSTAELAVAGMLAIVRDLPAFAAAQREHRWDTHFTGGLAGRSVLVIGAGDIGERIAAVVRTLEGAVTLVARSARAGVHGIEEVPALLPRHEVVVLAVPHTPQTHHLADAAFLAALPDGALVVNIARGGVLVTDALLAELTAGRLHAFLDVTDPEPLPADHPLWDAPNLLLTPHVGGGTTGWEERAYRLVHEQVERLLAGADLINQVRAGY